MYLVSARKTIQMTCIYAVAVKTNADTIVDHAYGRKF